MKVDDLFFRSSTQTGLGFLPKAETPFKNPRSATDLLLLFAYQWDSFLPISPLGDHLLGCTYGPLCHARSVMML